MKMFLSFYLILISLFLQGCFSSPGSEASKAVGDLAPVIVLGSGQATTTNKLPIKYKIEFKKNIVNNSFTSLDLEQEGSALGVKFKVEPTYNRKIYNISVVHATSIGTIIPKLKLSSVYSKGKRNYNLNNAKGPSVNYVSGGKLRLLSKLQEAEQSSNTNFLGSLNGKNYYTAESPQHGNEIFYNTNANPEFILLKDINDGSSSSNANSFAVLNTNQFVFAATNASHGEELWVSDGTETGTQRISDIRAGTQSSLRDMEEKIINWSDQRRKLFIINNKVVFYTYTDEIYSYNGSTLSLLQSDIDSIDYLGALANTLIFGVRTTSHGDELFYTDGTVSGSAILDHRAGATSGLSFSAAHDIHNKKYARMYNSTGSEKIHELNIDSNGILTATAAPNFSNIHSLVSLRDNKFVGIDSSNNDKLSVLSTDLSTKVNLNSSNSYGRLFCSHSTDSKTYILGENTSYEMLLIILDENNAYADEILLSNEDLPSGNNNICDFVMFQNNQLAILMNTSSNWVINKIADDNSISELKDLSDSDIGSLKIFNWNNKYFLSYTDQDNKLVFEYFDANLTEIKSMDEFIELENTISFSLNKITEAALYFTINGDMGEEMYYFDNTFELFFTKNFNSKLVGSFSGSGTNDIIISEYNNSLYISNKTRNYNTFYPYVSKISANSITHIDALQSYNTCEYVGQNSSSGNMLQYCEDENSENHLVVIDMNTNSASTLNSASSLLDPSDLSLYDNKLEHNNEIYFLAQDNTSCVKLWKTDLSLTGTLIEENTACYDNGMIEGLFFNTVLLSRRDSNTSPEVTSYLLSDATNANTTALVTDNIYNGISYGDYLSVTQIDSDAFFIRRIDSDSIEIWRTNGTSPGTSPRTQLNGVDGVRSIGKVGKFLIFHDGYLNDLYSYDTSNTSAPVVINSNISIRDFMQFDDDTLVLSAATGNSNYELYKLTDDTTPQLSLVKDIYTGSIGSGPSNFYKHNSKIYFTASTLDYGSELWESDLSSSGTVLFKDFSEAAISSSAVLLKIKDNKMILKIDDLELGNVVYSFDMSP